MSAATVLDRLDGVQSRGPGRWVARCPAHEDRSPSLSIRETSDGTVLVHDFAGCGAADILAAIGLGLRDLFPEALEHHRGPRGDRRHQHAAREALKSLSLETAIVLIACEAAVQGRALSDADQERLALAAARIRAAREVAA